jgi:hypothetical protein
MSVAQAKSRLLESAATAGPSEWVRDHPLLTAGAALIVGLVASTALTRRRARLRENSDRSGQRLSGLGTPAAGLLRARLVSVGPLIARFIMRTITDRPRPPAPRGCHHSTCPDPV